jgi:hypothetical protein
MARDMERDMEGNTRKKKRWGGVRGEGKRSIHKENEKVKEKQLVRKEKGGEKDKYQER